MNQKNSIWVIAETIGQCYIKLIMRWNNVTLGEILRNLLDEKDITQKQLADDLKIAASTLGNYVQNTREPDYELLKAIAEYFHVTTDYLLDHRAAETVNHQEDELLRIYRNLNNDQQELFVAQGKLYISYNNKKKNKPK